MNRRKSLAVGVSKTAIKAKISEFFDAIEPDKDGDETPWFARIHWAVFKSHLFFLTMLSLIQLLVLSMFLTVISKDAEGAFVSKGDTLTRRNFSALVPIWGGMGNEGIAQWLIPFQIDLIGICVMYAILAIVGLETYISIMKYRDGTIIMFLALYTIICIFAIFAEIHIIIVHSSYDSGAYRIARFLMKSRITRRYKIISEDTVTQGLNMIMVTGKCCGVDGPDDFSNVNMTVDLSHEVSYHYKYAPKIKPSSMYWPEDGLLETFKVPPVCCKQEFFATGSLEEQFERQKNCAMKDYSEEDQYVIGCGRKVYNMLKDLYYRKFLGLSSVVIYLKAILAFMCIVRILQHFDKSTE